MIKSSDMKVETKTRAIFHAIHSEEAGNAETMKRLTGLLSTEYLGVPDDFFVGKKCLDAGCGSTAWGTKVMLERGASHVTAIDLGDISDVAWKLLKGYEGKYTIDIGSVLSLPYPDNTFDFTHCEGVLHHTTNPMKGLAELCRVTKPGGMVLITIHGKGGVFHDCMNAMRVRYQNDEKFRDFIDTLDGDTLVEMASWTIQEMKRHGDDTGISNSALKEYINNDLALTIKDRLQAPLYTEFIEQEVRDAFTKNGFENVRRLTRYPRYQNIRRFLSPFYNTYDNKWSRIFFGEGVPQMIATKI